MLKVGITTLDQLKTNVGAGDEPLVVMPFIDGKMAARSAAQLSRRAGTRGMILCIQDVERKGYIAVINAAFRASLAPQFAYVAQDAFAGRNWLTAGIEGLRRGEGGLLAFNDGKWAGSLAAFGLVDKQWAASIYGGDLFHPEYKRHYADVELTLIAMQQRKLRYDPNAVLVEVDWSKEADGVVEAADKVLYHRRAQTAYDRKVPDASLRRLFK